MSKQNIEDGHDGKPWVSTKYGSFTDLSDFRVPQESSACQSAPLEAPLKWATGHDQAMQLLCTNARDHRAVPGFLKRRILHLSG